MKCFWGSGRRIPAHFSASSEKYQTNLKADDKNAFIGLTLIRFPYNRSLVSLKSSKPWQGWTDSSWGQFHRHPRICCLVASRDFHMHMSVKYLTNLDEVGSVSFMSPNIRKGDADLPARRCFNFPHTLCVVCVVISRRVPWWRHTPRLRFEVPSTSFRNWSEN